MVEETTNQGGEGMATPSVDVKQLLYNDGYVNIAVNTKEEAEILQSLFAGVYAWEERKALRDLKLSKIVDMF